MKAVVKCANKDSAEGIQKGVLGKIEVKVRDFWDFKS
jgi:hypothetical protein